MKTFVQKYHIEKREAVKINGTIRKMEKKDIAVVLKLYNQQVAKYKVYYKFSQDEIIHWLYPKEDVVWTYVIEDDNGVVQDFFAMYRLTQQCTSKERLGHNHDKMHSGSLFYYSLN